LETAIKRLYTLRAIKLAHTLIWVFFVLCIIGIPAYGHRGDFLVAGILFCLVLLECLVLAFNRMRCPLTEVAARYTYSRQDNFDIYLPLGIARYNKEIFGALFVVGSGYALFRWLVS